MVTISRPAATKPPEPPPNALPNVDVRMSILPSTPQCSGEPRPLSIDREGKFDLKAKPYCESLKLEIEVSPEVTGKIAALLASL